MEQAVWLYEKWISWLLIHFKFVSVVYNLIALDKFIAHFKLPDFIFGFGFWPSSVQHFSHEFSGHQKKKKKKYIIYINKYN